jgi:hypothetical protein
MAGLIASEIMDDAALLMNDSARVTWTYTVQVPWLKRAINALSDELAVSGIQLTRKVTSPVLSVATGAVTIPMPSDCIVPLNLYERLSGSSFPFIPLKELMFIPAGSSQTDSLGYWAYQGTLLNSVPVIDLLGATTNREVRVEYIRFLPYAGVVSGTDFTADIPWNAKRFLSAKTAEYITRFVLKDKVRGDELKIESGEAKYKIVQIWVKKQQGSPIRRPGFPRVRF